MTVADARALPFRAGSFDLIFGSCPWDNVDLVLEARSEFQRVLTKRGEMAFVLPNLDNPRLATLAVANWDWSERSSFIVEKPSTYRGYRYRGMSDEFVARVLLRAHRRRVLDPFCGTGVVPRVARRLGMFAVGCDVSREPLGVA